MLFSRQKYLDRLIAHKHNHQIKVVTGIRRCGKSFLLFNLFYNHLIQSGVEKVCQNDRDRLEITIKERICIFDSLFCYMTCKNLSLHFVKKQKNCGSLLPSF